MFKRSGKKLIAIVLILIISNQGFSDWRDNAKVTKISGGELHTIFLTGNHLPWVCGDNRLYQLGTGNDYRPYGVDYPVKVHGYNDNGFLGGISEISAGWQHSLALDVNNFVWSWGTNSEGQIGNTTISIGNAATTTVMVLSGEMGGGTYLHNIIAISAGRIGEHSLAVSSDNLVYAWGRGNEGQLGGGRDY
jgi:alpha-tubulin suppressor-like RCC1 family protein